MFSMNQIREEPSEHPKDDAGEKFRDLANDISWNYKTKLKNKLIKLNQRKSNPSTC